MSQLLQTRDAGSPLPAEQDPDASMAEPAFWSVEAETHAFFLDVDGSLIDIAPRPDAVVVPPALPHLLQTLEHRCGGALALVSGRTIGALDALLSPFRGAAAGAHGAELRPSRDAPIDALPPLDPALTAAVAAVAGRFDGVFAEDKGMAIAVHYRAAPATAPTLRAALAAEAGRFEGVQLLPGHGVFEVKRAGHDKGTAIAGFMNLQPFAGRIPVMIGDDVTDEAGFAAVGARGGVALAVGTHRTGAHGVLADPAAVRAFLSHLAASPRHRRR